MLEGIGLIEKKSKNSIQWKWVKKEDSKQYILFMLCNVIFKNFRPYVYKDTSNCNTQEIASKVAYLKSEISRLDNIENLLDLHKLWINQSIKNTVEDVDNKKYLYVTQNDLCQAFSSDDRIIVLNCPLETHFKIEVIIYFIFICVCI